MRRWWWKLRGSCDACGSLAPFDKPFPYKVAKQTTVNRFGIKRVRRFWYCRDRESCREAAIEWFS